MKIKRVECEELYTGPENRVHQNQKECHQITIRPAPDVGCYRHVSSTAKGAYGSNQLSITSKDRVHMRLKGAIHRPFMYANRCLLTRTT